MAVIIDTSVWVNALRVRNSPERHEVDDLLALDRARMVGIVLAEVIRGARDEGDYGRLLEELSAIDFVPETRATWTAAGRLLFELGQRGNRIPLPDALIAAHALEGGHEVYTLDGHFQGVPGLKLHVPEGR